MATAPEIRAGLSLEGFLRLPEIDRHPYLEYIDGRIVAKVSPKLRHSVIQMELGTAMNAFAIPRRHGQTFPELRCTFDGRSIVPDLVLLLEDHIAVDERGEFIDDVAIPPDLHVEIVSPKQGIAEADEKLRHSTAHGCALGWLIHPDRKAIDVYRPGVGPVRLSTDGVLEGEPVLPGFRLPVAEVFGWLRPRGGGGDRT